MEVYATLLAPDQHEIQVTPQAALQNTHELNMEVYLCFIFVNFLTSPANTKS